MRLVVNVGKLNGARVDVVYVGRCVVVVDNVGITFVVMSGRRVVGPIRF